jgi:hypothetical protein
MTWHSEALALSLAGSAKKGLQLTFSSLNGLGVLWEPAVAIDLDNTVIGRNILIC